jgi:hypothetical protein
MTLVSSKYLYSAFLNCDILVCWFTFIIEVMATNFVLKVKLYVESDANIIGVGVWEYCGGIIGNYRSNT